MEMPETTPRPDVDVEEDIAQLIRSYSPLKASRGYISYQSNNGKITVTGNVRSPQARRVLVDNIPHIPGVTALDANGLFDDEMVRVAVGPLVKAGVYVNVHYGTVALTGRLPEGATADGLIKAVSAVPGVRRVGAEFDAPASPEATRNTDKASNL